MRPLAIQIIEDEHLAISAVLYALRYLIKEIRSGMEPNFPLIKAIFDYIVSYPDRWHHPKEDQYLFAAIRRRTHEADELIERLTHEHKEGRKMIDALKQKLIEFQQDNEEARDHFFRAAERYAELEWTHLQTEEDLLIPIAERVLLEEDWQAITEAFRENDNPLFGIKPKDEANALYQRILALTPAPLGFSLPSTK